MSHPPEEPRLTSELRRLPRVEASPGFTAGALDRLERARRPRALPKKLLWASTATAAALAVGFALWSARPGAPRPETSEDAGEAVVEVARRVERLRAEHEALRRDLASLRAEAERGAPVIYLGGDEDLDLVLDLRPLAAADGPGPAGAALARDDRGPQRTRGEFR